jgi:HEPN domain-containing protein
MAEYEERLVYKSEAEKVLKDCERFMEFVKKELP